MQKECTKDRIMGTALKLFSENGYSAVSMRDIAAVVGIQASTIYHYFPGKREIFLSIISQAQEMTVQYRDRFIQALNSIERVESEPFVRAGMLFVTGYLRNERIEALLHTLESERFHDPEADAVWKSMLFTAPLEHETNTFRTLIARNMLRETDADRLAAEYHGIAMIGYFTGNLERMAEGLRAFYQRVFFK